jgi:hypothetical protein
MPIGCVRFSRDMSWLERYRRSLLYQEVEIATGTKEVNKTFVRSFAEEGELQGVI